VIKGFRHWRVWVHLQRAFAVLKLSEFGTKLAATGEADKPGPDLDF
jgi:hypothetical protein